MPSRLLVRCVPIRSVEEIVGTLLTKITIMGWQVVTRTDTNPQVGELRVFIPPDAILPQEFVDEHQIQYLKKGNRVGQVKLQHEMSFGLAIPNVWNFAIGQEVSKELGITKYIPPVPVGAGDQERDHPLFLNYAHIENWRNFPDLFKDGEEIVILEKIHGTNSKVGLLDVTDQFDPDVIERSGRAYEFMIGSHNTRKKYVNPDYEPPEGTAKKQVSLYQYPLEQLKPLLDDLRKTYDAKVLIVYGEIFGRVQDLRYGRPNDVAYRAFDLYVDGKFWRWEDAQKWFDKHHIKTAPVLYEGPYSVDIIKHWANQKTQLMTKDPHMSEGIVLRPKFERHDPEFGRVILKYKSDAYEERFAKGKGTEFA